MTAPAAAGIPQGGADATIGALPFAVRGYARRQWEKRAEKPAAAAAGFPKADAWLQDFAKPFLESRLPFDLDASDTELRDLADRFAQQYRSRIEKYQKAADVMALVRPLRQSVAVAAPRADVAAFVRSTALAEAAMLARREMIGDAEVELIYERGIHGALLERVRIDGLDPAVLFPYPKNEMTREERQAAQSVHIAKMQDALFWRRQFRKLQNRGVENLYRRAGMVHGRRQLYVSNDNLNRYRKRKAQIRALLEVVTMINELGQEFTLDALFDVCNSNPEIRRAELMVRIAGFESVALGLDHAGEFVTITCPSRFHARHHRSGTENNKFDGSTPTDAAQYLSKVWAGIRSALKREKIDIYGFRIAEPHHDGTPHWHGLFFLEKQHVARFRQIIALYACADSRAELGLHYQDTMKEANEKKRADWLKKREFAASRGLPLPRLNGMPDRPKYTCAAGFWRNAKREQFASVQSRVDFKAINWKDGSAAGYIAKYISKNVDGKTSLGTSAGPDLESSDLRDMTETAERVTCWASIHGIRQFQQIGGPPVSVWRELRRLDSAEADDYNDAVTRAAQAADRGDWGKFVEIMGGIAIKRKDRPIQLYKETTDTTTRYGEQRPPFVRGVVEPDTGLYKITRIHEWQVVLKKGGEAAAWTCVNNCTKTKTDAETPRVAGISAKKPLFDFRRYCEENGLSADTVPPYFKPGDFKDAEIVRIITDRYIDRGGYRSDLEKIARLTTPERIEAEKSIQAAVKNIRRLIPDDIAVCSLKSSDLAFEDGGSEYATHFSYRQINEEKERLALIAATGIDTTEQNRLATCHEVELEQYRKDKELKDYRTTLGALFPSIKDGGKGIGFIPADPVFDRTKIKGRTQTRLPLPKKPKTAAELLAESDILLDAVCDWADIHDNFNDW